MQSLDVSELPLDWDLARKRFERDVRDDFFPDPLRNRDLFVAARGSILEALRLNDYTPELAESWEVPKSNLTLRHCINVSAVDRLVYQGLVDHLAVTCDPQFSPRSYAFRLRAPDAAEMYLSSVEQFLAFDAAVRQRLSDAPASIVVTIDVAQYFENISLEILKRKLIEMTQARLGNPTRSVIDVLMQCLSSWTPYGKFGLPQNMFPSSFLGNVYLHSLDAVMMSGGYDYHRYMDDVRVIAADEASARRALKDAITHLRSLELSVNGKKTGLVRPGTQEWAALAAPPDTQLNEIEEIVRREDPAQLPAVVQRVNDMLVGVVNAGATDQRRLKFALGRLISIRRMRRTPVPEPLGYGPQILSLVKPLPEHTPQVCEYFRVGECGEDTRDLLVELLTTEPVCIYGWQNYHLWLLATDKRLDTPQLRERARRVIAQGTELSEVAGAAVFLGVIGDQNDYRLMVDVLRGSPQSMTARRALAIAVQQIEGEVQRTVLERVVGSSVTLDILVRYLTQLQTPHYVARPRRVPMRRLRDEMPDTFS